MKNNILTKIFFVIYTTAILLQTSCKTPEITTEIAAKQLPKNFVSTTENDDTLNIATKNWKEFYSDPYLIKLIDSSIVNNFNVLIALQKIKISKSQVSFKKNAMLPNLDFVASAGLTRYGKYTMDGAGNSDLEIKPGELIPRNLPDYLVGLQTSWELGLFGKLKNQKKAAVARMLSSTAMKNVVITNLIAEVAINYYELLALDQSVQIVNQNIAIQESVIELSKVMKEAASATELAVKQFEAQLLRSKSLKLHLEQQIIETENKLNFLVGSYPKPIERQSISIETQLPPEIHFGIPVALLQNRPDIKAAEFELLATKADLKSARAMFYPSIKISGIIGYQSFKTGVLFDPKSMFFNLLGSLTAPLINRNQIKLAFSQANATQVESLYNFQKTILGAYIEVNSEMSRIVKLTEEVNLKQKETEILKESITIATDLLKFGRSNYLEVLSVQQNALQAELDMISAKKQQLQSAVNIYKALGGGWRN